MATSGRWADNREAPAQAIREARAELDTVIEEIQNVAGFEDFLAPPAFDDVAEAAADHPLVYITPTDTTGLALIVHGARVTDVALPKLTTAHVAERVRDYLAAHDARKRDPQRWASTLDDVTGWLGGAAMDELLGAVKPAGEIVIVAGGLLGLLPLHAAWVPDPQARTGRRYALDATTIRYAPNARALSAARRRAADTAHSTALVVVNPKPVNAPALDWADIEGWAAARAFPERARVLPEEQATETAFRNAAPHVDVLHLACHGLARLGDPLQSGLLLAHNKWLTLRDLLTMRLHARLAVLSACETSRPGTALPDEVVALPTGLLQAGVASVIASLWVVPDFDTALLMARFYSGDFRTSPAAALQRAQRWMRDNDDDAKLAELERAMAGAPSWIAPDLAEPFADTLRSSKRSGRPGLQSWAGFVYVGA